MIKRKAPTAEEFRDDIGTPEWLSTAIDLGIQIGYTLNQMDIWVCKNGSPELQKFFRSTVAAGWLCAIEAGLLFEGLDVSRYIDERHGIRPDLEMSPQQIYQACWDLIYMLDLYEHLAYDTKYAPERYGKLYFADEMWCDGLPDNYPA